MKKDQYPAVLKRTDCEGIISLTPHAQDLVCPPPAADSVERAGAPADEIEVTPAMIAAGVDELSSRYLELQEGSDRFGEVVQILFARMLAARPR